MFAGRPYVVGEQGRELFVPDVAGTIIPAAQTAQMLNANPGSSTMSTQGAPVVNVYVTTQSDRGAEIAAAVGRRLSWTLGG